MNHFAKYISRNTLIRSMAALSILGVACMTASAQTLTLDNFKHGSYTKVLTPTQPADVHYEALAANSPLGAARETVFAVGASQYAAQSSTLSIGKGICIVDAGFLEDSTLQIVYGVTLSGENAPLGLNLGAYSGLQLNLPAISTDESLYLIIEIDPSSGGYYTSEVEVPSTPNASSISFPYTSFTQGGTGNILTQAEASDIDYIYIQAGAAWSSFGITSLDAVN
jgi:hypothetical protein